MILYYLSIIVFLKCLNSEVRFRPDAKKYLRVNYSKSGRQIRYNEMSISYKPYKMVIDNGDDDDDDELFTAVDIKLEIKIDDGCWSRVLGDPIQRGRSEVLWRLEIHPCQVDNNNIGQ